MASVNKPVDSKKDAKSNQRLNYRGWKGIQEIGAS